MAKKMCAFKINLCPSLHTTVLHSLRGRLGELGVNPHQFYWSMYDGEYKPNGNDEKFPDLLIFLRESIKVKAPSMAIPIELKTGRYNQRDLDKAIEQMYVGARFAIELQKARVEYGLFISTLDGRVLHPSKIMYEEMERRFSKEIHGRNRESSR